MKRNAIIFAFVTCLGVCFFSCERSPLFNIIGEEARSSQDFVINPPLNLDAIKRVGSVYGTPGGSADGTPHKGIDIGGDELLQFMSSTDGIVMMVQETRDNYTVNTDVIIRYNSEFSVLYTFEPASRVDVRYLQPVKTGEPVGCLGVRETGYIDQCVHFGLYKNGEFVCPVPYLREDLRQKLNEVYKSVEGRYPENICNCPEHQHYFEQE
ncbi:MAG: M23 family metallopeptidase [Bacteroidales bacterium]|nr:M23 family metallopeptidase [Bacteroidales bacterium]